MHSPYRHPDQARPSRDLDGIRALAQGADAIKVRANPKNWSQAEVLGLYLWGDQENLITPVDDCPGDDSAHAGLTIGEFLSTHRRAGCVELVKATDAAHTYLIKLTRPIWDDIDY